MAARSSSSSMIIVRGSYSQLFHSNFGDSTMSSALVGRTLCAFFCFAVLSVFCFAASGPLEAAFAPAPRSRRLSQATHTFHALVPPHPPQARVHDQIECIRDPGRLEAFFSKYLRPGMS